MSPLSIIIVNYCSESDVLACLASLENPDHGRNHAHVYVVDNCSPDGSGPRIDAQITQRGWANWATLLPAPHNGGFAYGNNVGLQKALDAQPRSELFLLLNPDTLVLPDAIKILVDFMDQNPKVGIAGARLEHQDGRSQWAARSFPTVLSEFTDVMPFGIFLKPLKRWVVAAPDRETRHATDWVVGAAMMIRRPVLEQIGLMDDAYFLYYEEVDFCLMANRAGWPTWYVPESRIIHLVGQSTGVGKAGKRKPRYWFESRRRFFLKSYGWLTTKLADIVWATFFPLSRAYAALLGRNHHDPHRYWLDFVTYNFFGYYRQ